MVKSLIIEKFLYQLNITFYCALDCLPSFGHLQLAALQAADYVLIPVKPSPYALAGMQDLFQTIKKTKKYFNSDLSVLGILINQVDGRKLVIEREMEDALRETYGKLVFKNRIKKRVKIEESPSFQKSIIQYDSKSPGAQELKKAARELKCRLKDMEKNETTEQ